MQRVEWHLRGAHQTAYAAAAYTVGRVLQSIPHASTSCNVTAQWRGLELACMQVNTLRWGSKVYNQSDDSSYLVLRIVGQVLVQIGQAVGVLAQVVVYHPQLVARRRLPA